MIRKRRKMIKNSIVKCALARVKWKKNVTNFITRYGIKSVFIKK